MSEQNDNTGGAAGGADSTAMKITVKTPKEQHVIEIDANATIKEVTVDNKLAMNLNWLTMPVFILIHHFQFRAKVAEKFNQSEELLCLIFAGKIMKDTETLTHHKLGDGYVVHLVIKSSARGPQDPSSRPTSSNTTSGGNNSSGTPQSGTQPNSNPMGSLFGSFGLPNLGSMGLGGPGMMNLQDRVQQELMSNPDALRQVLDSPIVQNMMSNPVLNY